MRKVMLLLAAVALQSVWGQVQVHRTAKGYETLSAEFVPAKNSFTASLLFKPEYMLPAAAINGMLLRLGSGYFDGFRLSMACDPRIGGFYPIFELGKEKRSAKLDAREAVMKPGFWQRVTCSWDGRRMRLYLNGRMVASMPYSGNFIKPRNKDNRMTAVDLKELYGLVAYPVLVGEMSAWDRALSDEEIASLPMKAFAPDTPELSEFFARVDRCDKVTVAELKEWKSKNVISALTKSRYMPSSECSISVI
jgi:hypothetical protein